MKTILVFKYSKEIVEKQIPDKIDLQINEWRPSLINYIPPNSPNSYFVFWIFHFLHIFKNREYCAYSISGNDSQIASLVCVPAVYLWSFMERTDIQIKNVYTNESNRGKGFAKYLINHLLKSNLKTGRDVWYITSSENIISQKLCTSMGFVYQGTYTKSSIFCIVKIGKLNI